MAFTQTDLDNLKSALASGHLEVSFQGRTVRYQSISELHKAIEVVESELTEGTSNKPARRLLVRTSQGF